MPLETLLHVHGAAAKHINLVLWDWSDAPPDMVKVHDPFGRLPRNRKSWDKGDRRRLLD
jgi:RES domain-containing protein